MGPLLVSRPIWEVTLIEAHLVNPVPPAPRQDMVCLHFRFRSGTFVQDMRFRPMLWPTSAFARNTRAENDFTRIFFGRSFSIKDLNGAPGEISYSTRRGLRISASSPEEHRIIFGQQVVRTTGWAGPITLHATGVWEVVPTNEVANRGVINGLLPVVNPFLNLFPPMSPPAGRPVRIAP
jgi:hypothetical protein